MAKEKINPERTVMMDKAEQNRDEHIDFLITLLSRHGEINMAQVDPSTHRLTLSFCLERRLEKKERQRLFFHLKKGVELFEEEGKLPDISWEDSGEVTEIRLKASLALVDSGFFPFFIELLSTLAPVPLLREKTPPETLELVPKEEDKIWGFSHRGRVKVFPCR